MAHWYVTLAHVHAPGAPRGPNRGRRWVPQTATYGGADVDDLGGPLTLASDQTERVLSIWRVEGVPKTIARDLVVSHLAGFARVGVELVWSRERVPAGSHNPHACEVCGSFDPNHHYEEECFK